MAASTNNYGFPYPQDSDIVDVAGDIQSLAEDIDSKLSEAIADTVGLMVTSNTENGITVTYDDTDNTLDFNVPAFDITFLGDISGTGNILNLGSASAVITVIDDSHNHSSATISDFAEAVADTVGNMVNSNTENGISVTYDDTDNTLDFDVNDFNIVLSGDVSGSATVTNLASINISASVADNSHNHTSSNITDFESSVQSVTDSFTTVNVPSGTDPLATLYNDTLTITENNGILITGTGSNTLNVSTNATFNNTASALVSRDSNRTFDITAIDFDTSASATPQIGRLHWSDGEGTLSTLLKNGNIELAIGQEEVALCYNGSGSPMTTGQVVYISGAQGQKPSIVLASSSSEASSSKTFGVVAEPIANGEEGFITTFGVIKDVNTSSYSEGSSLWLSTVAGEIITTKPTQPDHAVFIGYSIKQHASAGQIFVNIQNGYEIEELQNVLITSASAGDVLIYNSASALWINENFNERAQDAIATMISNGTQNNITVSYNDGSNSLSFSVSDSASTNVQGTANEIEVTSASNIFTVGLPNNVTISNDLTVSGNMTVSGSTTYLNTTELLVEDNLITLNSGEVGSPSLNAGIEIERGTSANTSIRWNESTDVWEFTNDGTTFYTIKDFDTALATKTTDNLTQGSTNLYFTDERAQDAISTAIAAGTQTNITVSYDDSTNSFSFVSVDPGVTSLAGTADEVTVSASAGAVTLSLPATINANTTGTAAALTTPRTIELTGDVTGSVSFDGSASASIVTTVVNGGGGGVTSLAGTADEITVSASAGAVTLSLPATINANTTGTAAALTTARTIELTGDVTGSVSFDGSASASIVASIEPNSVALGTDTTGNYVATAAAGSGIEVSGSGSETAALTITNTGVTSLTGTADEVTVSASAGAVTLSLPATINANTTGTAAALTTPRTIELTGDVTGSVSFDGSASASIVASIEPNSVALGTDTTGNYVATAAAGTGIEVSGSGSETAALTITNTGVTSLAGTAGQISVSASSGNPTISLPSAVTFPGTVTLNADPTVALQAATKQYVDTLAQGLHVHASVQTATTDNINLNNSHATIDGVTLTNNMRVLVKNQSVTYLNGIYVSNESGNLTRAADFDNVSEIQGGDFVFVTGGTVNNNTGWVQTETINTLDTDPILFNQFTGVGTYAAGTGLLLTGNVFSNTGVTSLLGTADEVTVSASAGAVTLSLPATINANTTGTAAALTTARTIELTGDVTGSVSFDGSASASIVTTVVGSVNINSQSASYTVVLEDAGKTIEMNSASANTVTIPLNSSVEFAIGTTLDIIQYGAGQTTIVATGGVTLRSKGGALKLTGQYSGATLYKRGTDEWVVVGDLTV